MNSDFLNWNPVFNNENFFKTILTTSSHLNDFKTLLKVLDPEKFREYEERLLQENQTKIVGLEELNLE